MGFLRGAAASALQKLKRRSGDPIGMAALRSFSP
jgi:hypothetical protein